MKNLRLAFVLALATPLGACAHLGASSAQPTAFVQDSRVQDAARAWCGFYKRHFDGVCTLAQRQQLATLLAADMAATPRSEMLYQQRARQTALKTAIADVLGITMRQLEAAYAPARPANIRR